MALERLWRDEEDARVAGGQRDGMSAGLSSAPTHTASTAGPTSTRSVGETPWPVRCALRLQPLPRSVMRATSSGLQPSSAIDAGRRPNYQSHSALGRARRTRVHYRSKSKQIFVTGCENM